MNLFDFLDKAAPKYVRKITATNKTIFIAVLKRITLEKGQRMLRLLYLLLFVVIISGCRNGNIVNPFSISTVCNPLNISYRFQLNEPSRREAADPTVVVFRGKYYLFASKSGGYWYSSDLTDWTFVQTDQIPTEDYAPTVVNINDTLYFYASSSANIYKTDDPMSGNWSVAKENFEERHNDPVFFLDDDNRLYLYWGASPSEPIKGIEIDYKNNFEPVGKPIDLIASNPSNNGWEVPGDFNTKYNGDTWMEGPWLNKHEGKYYLQYACPGTEYKSYADGVYVSDSPLGPFRQAKSNPYSSKQTGFVRGIGHGSTFSDNFGNYWHIGSVTIAVKNMFERRLALFPAFFSKEGELHCDTRFGDFPLIIPKHKINNSEELFPGWMLLSYKKKVNVSSVLEGHSADYITDENICTCWSAKTGNSDEWVTLDLGDNYDVCALQLNFAEQNTNTFGRKEGLCFQYLVEVSSDNKKWRLLLDKSENTYDRSHDYVQLSEKVNCRYLRLKNIRVADGYFALSAFRVFGKGGGDIPAKVNEFKLKRDHENRRTVRLSWNKNEKAIGYLIRYGYNQNKLWQSYLVYDDTFACINNLDASLPYYFEIRSFNENGISESTTGVKSK